MSGYICDSVALSNGFPTFDGAEAVEPDEGVSPRSLTAAAATSMDQETATEAALQCRGREAAVADAQCRGGGSVVASGAARRGRCSFFFDGDDEPPSTTAGRMRCRSCAAVAIADCVALGCCPCAVVSLLGLALVKAPLVVGRRCVGRLRRRRRLLLQNKRVRDVAAASAASAPTVTRIHGEKGGVKAEVVTAGAGNAPPGSAAAAASVAVASPLGAPGTEAELAWLEEMYRVGHWGFGRVSFSGKTTP